jgi:prevent-host-death family protein
LSLPREGGPPFVWQHRRELDEVASRSHLQLMRSVGLKTLKNKLSEYGRIARAGETVLITDRNRVVAEIVPPQPGRRQLSDDDLIAEGVREGWLTPATIAPGRTAPAPAHHVVRRADGRLAARSRRPLIYLDSSVALAHLLGEGKSPAPALWREPQISSQLLEYELWNRMHARSLTGSYHDAARTLIAQVTLLRSWRERPNRFRCLSARLTACTSLRSNSCAGEGTPSSWQVTTTD